MVVKAYLRGDDSAIPLSSDRTTIGRSDRCDVVINDCHLDPEHCIIEFCDCENKMILTDLNTTCGTFVNSCKVHNAVVEIGQGDIIKFGKQGQPMRLVVNSVSECTAMSSSQNLQQNTFMNRQKVQKFDIPYWKSPPPHTSSAAVDLSLPSLNIKQSTNSPAFTQGSTTGELNELIREKDRKLVQMGEEINRLSSIEAEMKQKDRVISAMKQHSFHRPSTAEPFTCSSRSTSVRYPSDPHQHQQQGSRLLFQKINEENHRNEKLRVELDDIRRSYQSSQGLTHSLQQEISNKEALLIKNSSQIENLKKQVKQGEQKVTVLSSRCAKLVEENRTEQLDKQLTDLKAKWKTQETRLRNQIDLLQSYKDELMKVTSSQQLLANEKSQASKEASEIKQQFYQLQRSEKMLRVDVEQTKALYEKFRTKMSYLLSSADPQFNDAAGEVPTDGIIINRTQKVFLERNDLQVANKDLEKSLRNLEEGKSESSKAKEECQDVLKSCVEALNVNGRKPSVLERELEKLSEIDGTFSWVAKSASSFLQGELKSLQTFERNLLSIKKTPNPDKTPGDHLLEVYQNLLSANEKSKELECLIETMKDDHEVEKMKLQEQLHENLSQEHQLELENIRDQCKSSFDEDLRKSLEEQKSEFEQQLGAEQEKLQEAKEEIEKYLETINEKQSELHNLQQELSEAQKTIEEKSEMEKCRSSDMATMEEACQSSIQKMRDQMEENINQAEIRVKQYEEESKQHSLTIVALEKKLQELNKVLESRDQISTKTTQTADKKNPEAEEEVEMMKAEMMTLKSELFLTRETLQMQQDRNTKLMRDLRGAESRLSDMAGELSESMKEELEYNRNLVKNLQLEQSENQQKLFKMSEVIETQKNKLKNLQQEVKEKTKSIELAGRKELIERPETREQSCEACIELQEPSHPEPRCHGERHQEVILRQREALAELREQIKALEQIQAPLPGQEQALKQVVLLKRELAEIRAKKAMEREAEEDEEDQQQPAIMDEDNPNHLLLAATAQATLERSSRQELQESIISSEKTYMDLVSSIQPLLGIKSVVGGRSFSNIPADERDKLCFDRKQDLDTFIIHMKGLIQRLDQKERLLQNYENDLGKFREAENVAVMKSTHLDLLRKNLIDKTEESNNLRRALDEKRAECESEKRLNSMIKQRKEHRCKELYPPPYDNNKPTNLRPSPPTSANRSKTKRIIEMKKRRDYEFEVLRKEKEEKERELCQTTARLVNLQNSLKRELAS